MVIKKFDISKPECQKVSLIPKFILSKTRVFGEQNRLRYVCSRILHLRLLYFAIF